MVKANKSSPKMQSTYYLKPGQTLENTKISDRSLALLVPKRTFGRFVDYTTENERLAAAAKKEAAKLAALKAASYEMSKSWDNTVANIQKRRDEELLSRKKKDEEARVKFANDLAERNSAERAEIVNEARKLLLWKKPQCRLINAALFNSECYRQLDAQLAFKKTLENVDKEREAEYAKLIKEDAENAMKEEKMKAEELLKRNRAYGVQLKEQIKGINNDLKQLEIQEMASEKEDIKNMAKEIRMIEECEAQNAAEIKKEFKKSFIDALEEKKQQEMEVQRNNEFENRALEVLRKSRDRMKEIGKLKMKEAKEFRLKHLDDLSKKCAAVMHSREAEERAILRRASAEKEALELKRQEDKKKHKEKMRADMRRHEVELAAMKERRANEEKDIMAWETLQRFKRDEYNKEVLSEESKREWKKKMENANFLREQMAEASEHYLQAEQKAQLQREDLMDNNAAQMKANITRTNEKVLAYGQQVLDECKTLNEANPDGPKRPLYPIQKAIEEFKKESGLATAKEPKEWAPPKRKGRRRRKASTKPPE